jgi:hypothetical protein
MLKKLLEKLKGGGFMKIEKSLKERINKLPLELQLVFYEDIYEAIKNRLEVLEKVAVKTYGKN